MNESALVAFRTGMRSPASANGLVAGIDFSLLLHPLGVHGIHPTSSRDTGAYSAAHGGLLNPPDDELGNNLHA